MMKKTASIFMIIISLSLVASPSLAEKEATVRYTRPSEFHIDGIKKLTFAPFSHTMSYHEKGSKHLPQIIMEELEKEDFFDIVGPKEISPLEMDEEMTIPQLISYGRRAGADGVIYGEITGFQVCGYECGQMRNTADVSFCVELVNVKRGKAVDRKCFSGSGTETLKATGQLKGVSSDERMVLGVAKKVAAKFAKSITPSRFKKDVPFEGGKRCKAGVKLAAKGDWASAEATWMQALSEESGCDCALYNIGLSNEVKTNYTEALDYYNKALSAKPDEKLYKNAVKRVETRIADGKELKTQMQGR